MGVKPQNELFNGFSKKEMAQALVGSLIGGGIAILVWLLSQNVALTVVAVLVGIFGSVMMCVKDQYNLSVVDQVGNMFRFLREQQTYPYRYMNEWPE